MKTINKDSAGKSEKSTNLRVYQRPEIKSFRNESYDQYQRSYLECRVIGIPIPMITIRKNGLTRPFIHGDPGIVLEERMDKHEKVLTLTYLNTVNCDYFMFVYLTFFLSLFSLLFRPEMMMVFIIAGK